MGMYQRFDEAAARPHGLQYLPLDELILSNVNSWQKTPSSLGKKKILCKKKGWAARLNPRKKDTRDERLPTLLL